MGKNATKTPTKFVKNTIEAINEYGSDAAKTVAKTTVQEVDTLFADLLGLGSSSTESTHEKQGHNGETVLFSKEKKAESHGRGHIEYHADIAKSGEKHVKMEAQQRMQKLKEALAEVQQLAKSVKTLDAELAPVVMAAAPKEAGESDLNFIDWLILMIKQARMKVEDSGAWLSAVKGKNGKKGNFINDMWKKGNTSVTMSNERSSATSVG